MQWRKSWIHLVEKRSDLLVTRQLYSSLLNSMQSEAFDPKIEVELQRFIDLYKRYFQ